MPPETLSRVGAATARGARWTGQAVRRTGGAAGRGRSRMAGGETGMIRLFDLHAVSIAGDTLVTVGLAGTIFFAVPLGEARGNVALYLLVTMLPFAVLAPLIGPLLDRLRHGRRYALAATMLGRAILAWLIADYLGDFGLYPAAFGVLALSRGYGVARAAAVPRLLPERLGLSRVNARGSVYGTLAGLLVLPLGLAALQIGPQWPLRVASVIFLVGMVLALRLPARADSDPPETVPRMVRWARNRRQKTLTSRLVTAALAGSAIHRCGYGFLLIFLAFSIRADQLPGLDLDQSTALGVLSGALVTGTFLAVAAGSRLQIRWPMAWQAAGLAVVAVLAVAATLWPVLPLLIALCLAVAVSSGLAKVSVDSAIQEKIDEHRRASAFARSETLLMLAFVAGSAVGLIPFPAQAGLGLLAGLLVLAAIRALVVGVSLRREPLAGRPVAAPEETRA